MPNKLESLASDFERKYEPVLDKLYKEIQAGIEDVPPSEVADFVRKIFQKYNIDDRTEKIMLDFIIQGASIGIGQKIDKPVMFRQWWLNKSYDSEGVVFSERINDLARADEMIDILKESLRVCKSWNQTSYDLLRSGIQQGDVSKPIQTCISNARKIGGLVDDSEFAAQYASDLRKAQRAIDLLKDPDTSTLRRAYQNVVNLTKTSSEKAIEKAAKYAVYFKQKFNTERIAITELSRAYGQARIVEMQSDSSIIGCQIALSPDHPKQDICDLYANADLYGMGPGMYPKDQLPPYPFHPFCLCFLNDIFSGETDEASASDFDETGGKKYLQNLSADERKELLGIAGSKEFKNNPDSWPDLLKGYNEPEKVTGKIPLNLLYGK